MSSLTAWAWPKGGSPASYRARAATRDANRRAAAAPTPPTIPPPTAHIAPARYACCQWPTWAHTEPPPRPATFCDAPTQPGSPYCPSHHTRSRLPPKPRVSIGQRP